MAGSLDGKIAVITGAGSGIGAATAKVFAREGATVVLADVNVEGGQQVASEIGGDATFITTDVTQEHDVIKLIEQTVARFGRLDCAFNNAGIIGDVRLMADYPLDTWNRVISVNLTGVWLCVQSEIRQMLTNGGESIVNAASVAGLRGSAAIPAYSASKHGVIGITKSAAKGYGSSGIRVVCGRSS